MPFRYDEIGNRLKAYRLGSGLSAEEIATQLGISRTALYRFEKGELAKIETIERLAELLGARFQRCLASASSTSLRRLLTSNACVRSRKRQSTS